MKTKTHKMRKGVQLTAVVLVLTLISACASMEDQSVSAVDSAQADSATGSELADSDAGDKGKTSEQLAAEAKVQELEKQLASLKVEWEQQKPALERLVTNEADLEFLVKALADMSQLADEPSREQYLGHDELTPEKRQESLQALQSLVTTQEELNTLLVELSTVVSEVSANRQVIAGHTASVAQPVEQNALMPTDTQTVNLEQSAMPYSGTVTSGQPNNAVVSAQADCNCSSSESSSPVYSDPARSKDPSWYAMTTPYAEATPAGSTTQVSQLDGAGASGQPIPGLQVKTFKRRTLPSELAAAGADMQQYAMAPQFHLSRKSLSDYVSQLAFKLAGNQQLAGNKIGVASFVFFDEQLEKTSAVGNQLAEELSTVLPSYGARVIEYKLTREITVGPTGDLSLSRNTRKLRDSQGMDYILTGTMVPTRRGLQIHSRVVSTRDNVVIASASTLIPAMVLQQL